MTTDRLATAARDLLGAASEPITFPSSPGSDQLVLVPATYLEFLRSALGPEPAHPHADGSECFRGESGEHIVLRYLDIPDLPPGEVDEIVCGPFHLETLDTRHAYITVAGLMVNIWARDGWLSITCGPDDCTPITHEEAP